MTKADLVGGILLALASLLLIFVIIPMQTEDGAFFGLSPTVFPTVMATGMGLCAVGLIFQSLASLRLRNPSATEGGDPLPVSRWNLLMFVLAGAVILGGVLAIDFIGILVGAPLMIVALMLILGERGPIRILLTAILPVAAVYGLATYILQTPLP